MTLRTVLRWALAAFMLIAGVGHFVATEQFLKLVPGWLPQRRAIVWATGAIELGFAPALAFVSQPRRRRRIGWALAAFFVFVFPGNVHQALTGTSTFGLDTPAARWARLPFQPLLMAWALWATGAWPHAEGPGSGRVNRPPLAGTLRP